MENATGGDTDICIHSLVYAGSFCKHQSCDNLKDPWFKP